MRSGWMVLVLGVLAMSGCGSDKSAKNEPSKPADYSTSDPLSKPPLPDPGSESAGKPTDTAKPETPKVPEPEKKSILPKTPAIREKAFTVPQATAEGWKKSSMPIAQLARRVDDAMANSKGIGAKTEVYADIPEGTGRVTLYARVQDHNRYSIEYVHPSTRLSVNLLIADGKRQARREGGEWKHVRVLGSGQPPTIAAWLDGFTAYALASMTDGYAAWSWLASSLPKAGFTMSAEEARFSVRGQPRTFYRFVAKKPNTLVEARFDGVRMLPVTIRVVRQMGPRESKIMWTTAYSFNHQFTASTFRIPTVASATP